MVDLVLMVGLTAVFGAVSVLLILTPPDDWRHINRIKDNNQRKGR